LEWKEALKIREKACQKISLWVCVSASGFFFVREPFLAKKASCGSRGTVLSTADAGKDQQIFTL
jgi:hypothetical protein